MHILVAPNAFKNSLDAVKAAEAISHGLLKSNLSCTTTNFPVADGGDGTGKLLSEYLNAEKISMQVRDPLGRIINSSFGWIEETRTAIIELAHASGLRLLKQDEYDPLHATTYGTGQLIKAAINKKAGTIIICIGGSATVDGGCGIMQALGIRFLDKGGKELAELPASLSSLAEIIIPPDLNGLTGIDFVVLCDVENYLLGPAGAAAVFGPQKGASKADVQLLDNGLTKLCEIALRTIGKDMNSVRHGGAAGGVAAGLYAILGAKLVNGIDRFLEITGFENELKRANMVITGEGSMDEQTLEGKGPYGVAKKAKQYSLPVIGMAGKVSEEKKLAAYFDELVAITPAGMNMKDALANTYTNLEKAACELGSRLAQ